MFYVCAFLLSSLLFLQSPGLIHLSTAPAPREITSVTETGLVVLRGEIDANGEVGDLQVKQGTAPFVEPSLQAVRRWIFDRPQDGDRLPVSIILLFRARTDLPNEPHEFSVPLNPEQNDGPPQPESITDPGYPFDSSADGTVILQLQIDDRGQVRKTDVVGNVPSLTEAAVDAVSQWRFSPAKQNGKSINGVAVAVISFRRPNLIH